MARPAAGSGDGLDPAIEARRRRKARGAVLVVVLLLLALILYGLTLVRLSGSS